MTEPKSYSQWEPRTGREGARAQGLTQTAPLLGPTLCTPSSDQSALTPSLMAGIGGQ